jgi:hypothetical protein
MGEEYFCLSPENGEVWSKNKKDATIFSNMIHCVRAMSDSQIPSKAEVVVIWDKERLKEWREDEPVA